MSLCVRRKGVSDGDVLSVPLTRVLEHDEVAHGGHVLVEYGGLLDVEHFEELVLLLILVEGAQQVKHLPVRLPLFEKSPG